MRGSRGRADASVAGAEDTTRNTDAVESFEHHGFDGASAHVPDRRGPTTWRISRIGRRNLMVGLIAVAGLVGGLLWAWSGRRQHRIHGHQ